MACVVLIILGGIAQIVGFGLTYYELSITQRREFPDRIPWHHRVLARVRSRLGLTKPPDHAHTFDAAVTQDAVLAKEVSRAPASTLEDRVKRLELEMVDLRRKQHEDHAALEGRVVEAHQRITAATASLSAQLDETERKRKEALSESLIFQRVGVGFFVLGAILSVLGSSL
ncbi:MAG TPA: hypothetical protein VFY36_00580 [Solirubrobacteraceae bacterium]|nr:hypothetical protein [Solirubrobacteraceae bacterium]